MIKYRRKKHGSKGEEDGKLIQQVDGLNGDHILLAPPYTVTADEIAFIVDTLAVAIEKSVL